MKWASYMIYALLVAGIVMFSVLWYGERDKVKELEGILEYTISTGKGLNVIQDYRNIELLLNGKKIATELSLSDGKGNEVAWEQVLSGGDKLVLYFPEASCDECVDVTLSRVKARGDVLDSERVIILIHATSRRYVAQYKANAHLNYPIFEVQPRHEDLFPTFTPCLFLVEQTISRINTAYIPRRENPEGINRYLDKIIADYF
jgi:hypothetical protein